MSSNLIDLYNHILKYKSDQIYIAFHYKTQEPYFHAKQLCQMLEYARYHEALQKNVNTSNIFYLKDIVINYKKLYKNVQGHTKFINEAGLYSLILKSQKKEAKSFFDWITHEVMPSIRQYGEYKLNHKLKKQIDDLNIKLEQVNQKLKIAEHNLKKPKLKKGNVVYILRTVHDTVELNENDTLYLKFGRTKDMKDRIATYNTCTKNRVQILKTILLTDVKTIETCVLKKMNDYRIQNQKEYFECSYNQLIKQIKECVNFYNEQDFDTKPDIYELSRTTISSNDLDNVLTTKIISKDEFDKLFPIQCNTLSESETESDESNDEYDDNQIGGVIDYEQYYYKYKIKYLMLQFETLQ